MVPRLQQRADALIAHGWTQRDAERLALVCLHSGVFFRSQYLAFIGRSNPALANRFVRPCPRVTHILGQLRLASALQHHILSMPRTVGCPKFGERVVRVITMVEDGNGKQKRTSVDDNPAVADERLVTRARRRALPAGR